MKVQRPTDHRPPSLEELRRTVILGRAVNTVPETVDGLLCLADLTLANSEVVL